MKTSFFLRIAPIALVLAASMLVLLPLFRPGFIQTDDGGWMVVRLSAFYQSLREGQFPVRFLGRLNYSYGYPVANFLYPGFLYVGSMIKLLGFSFIDSIKLIIILSVVGSTLLVRQWLRAYFNSRAATIGAISFVAAPYLSFDIYRRGSVGEIFAFTWAALAFFAISRDKRSLFALAIFLIIVGHNSLAVLFIASAIVYLIVVKKLGRYALPFVLGVGMAAFFWLPALYERQFVVFDRIVVSDPRDYLAQKSLWWLVGLSGVVAAIISIFVRHSHPLRNLFFWLFVGATCMTLPLSGFLWRSEILVLLFQFPFRFLSVSILAGAWLTAYCVEKNVKLRTGIMVVILAGCTLQFITATRFISYESFPEGYYTTNEATTTVHDEYMPVWVSDKPTARANQKLEFHSGGGVITEQKVTTQYIKATVEAAEDSILQINTLFYPGWGVTVDGKLTPVDHTNDLGVMRIAVPQGVHVVTASFRETVFRFIADSVSAGFFLLFILYALGQGRKRKKKT